MEEDAFTIPVSIKIFLLSFSISCLLFLSAVDSFAWENPSQTENELSGEMALLDVTTLNALFKKSRLYHFIIIKAAKRHDVDPALIKAIIMAESGYDAQAVSSQGAAGLMQLMPKTAESLGVEDAFNPVHNVNGGVKYLKQLLEEFDHDIVKALAAYNAGSSIVRRHQGVPPIKATQHYVKKVFAYYQYFKNQSADQTDSV